MAFTDGNDTSESTSFTEASKTTLTQTEQQPRFVVISAKIFTEEQCQEILDDTIPDLWRDMKFMGENQKLAKAKIHKIHSEDKTSFPHAPIYEAFKTIDEQVFQCNTQGHHVNDYMTAQEFSSGGYYSMHQDLVTQMNTRKLTAIVNLTKREDYDGGDLRFLNIPNSKEFNEQGYIHIFPSFFAWEITKIKKGKKQIISAFAHGEEWK
jgi:hypothetical protein